jgi:rubredoxin
LKYKKEVKALLAEENYSGLLDLTGAHGGKTANILISLAGDLDEVTRWRAIKGLGLLTDRLYEQDPEKARRVLRQLIWNLNDESGGIGWGMPEAFGEILVRQADLAREYSCILAGYLVSENCLDQQDLQQGLVWALGRVGEFAPEERESIKKALLTLMKQARGGLRAMTVWALGELGVEEALPLLDDLPREERMINLMAEDGVKNLSFNEVVDQTRRKLKAIIEKEVGKLNDWKCSKCGYTLKADTPPETCPQCKEKCEFVNVTCYIPECGFSGSDDRLKGDS